MAKTVPGISESDKPSAALPYTAELVNIASEIVSEITASGGTILERSGMLGLAILFEDLAAGKLTRTQTFTLLKDLLMHKTPAPVQRIEQHTVLDMGALLKVAVSENRASMDRLDAAARAGKLEVMDRLGLDETLELPHRALEGKVEDEATFMGEPEELAEIRRKKGIIKRY